MNPIITQDRLRQICSTAYRKSWKIKDTIILFKRNDRDDGTSELYDCDVRTVIEYGSDIKVSNNKNRVSKYLIDLTTSQKDKTMGLTGGFGAYVVKLEDLSPDEAQFVVTKRLANL